MSGTESPLGEDEVEHLDVSVPALMDEMRIDRALAMLTGCSRSEAVALISDGAVSVDGTTVSKPSRPLQVGEHLEAVLPPPADGSVAPEEEVVIDVVYEDADLVVVNKPAALVVHPGAGNRTGTLIAGLLARYPEIASLPVEGFGEIGRPGVVHRLDKGTSGLVAVARSPRGFESLTEQLASHAMERRYVSVVEGHLEDQRGVIDAPLGRSATSPTTMTIRPDGRDARTHYELLCHLEGPDRSVVGLRLETGRTHQIRVHMRAIGHPVVNDPRYGQRNERRLDADRLALHAGRLGFMHPTSDDEIVLSVPWPADLEVLGGTVEANDWLAAG